MLSLRQKLLISLVFLPLMFMKQGVGCVYGAEVSQEYQLKGALLFNFARFTKWPEKIFASESEPITFCIIGDNPFGTILSKLESKKIENHPIEILYVNDPTSLPKCHLAFYANSEEQSIAEGTWTSSTDYTLNVSDARDFINKGGDVEFVKTENRLKFVINNSRLKKKGLRARASLLELAAEIR